MARIGDEDFRWELTLEMRCIIHKYAVTLDDINRLEEVIGLQEAMSAMEFQKMRIFKEGFKEGRFEKALEIKRKWGIEEALRLSDFSRQELESEKLNR